MSDKPRIGSSAHADRYPERLSLYNANYHTLTPLEKVLELDEPWYVDRGWNNLRKFRTHEKALTYLLFRAEEE